MDRPMSAAVTPSRSYAGWGYDSQSVFGASRPAYRQVVADVQAYLYNTASYGGAHDRAEVAEIVRACYNPEAAFENPVTNARGRRQIANHFAALSLLPGEIYSEIQDVCESRNFRGCRSVLLTQMLHINLRLPYFGAAHSEETERGLQPHSRSASVMTAASLHPLQRGTRALSITNGRAEDDDHPLDESARQRLTSCASWMNFYYGPDAHSQAVSAMPSNAATPMGTPARLFGSTDQTAQDDDDAGSRQEPQYDHATANYSDQGDSTESAAQLGLLSHWSSKIPSYIKQIGGKAYGHFPSIPRPCLQLELRILTRLDFNDSDQIYRHEDSYSVKDIIDALPILGRVYAAERIVMSYLIGYLSGWLLGGNKADNINENSILPVSLIKAADTTDDNNSLMSEPEPDTSTRSVEDIDHSHTRQPIPFPSTTSSTVNGFAPTVMSNDDKEALPYQRVSTDYSERRPRTPSKFGLGLGSSTKSRVAPPRTSRGISYLETHSPSKKSSQPQTTAADKLAAAISADSASDSADTAPMSPNVDR